MSQTDAIYLDYAATTPVDPEVALEMCEALTQHADFGNAASATHVFGRRAHARVETARAQVAALIGAAPEDVIFTSGATESNNLAVLGVARASLSASRRTAHIVTTRIEHKAVLDPCRQLEREGFSVTYVVPDETGRVRPDALRAALRAETVLVSVMHVNNETGVIQDVQAIGEICRERSIVFHVDAAQSVGKLSVDVSTLPVDLLSFTAHKIYGPKGIGALYVRRGARASLRPVSFGGGQERGLRPGTLPNHQIIGFGTAARLAMHALGSGEPARIASLRERLWQPLACLEGVHLNGEGAPRVPGILNVSFEGVEGESLVTALTSLAVTTGSACSSASGDPSYVLRALGRNTQLAQSSLRFSFGRHTTERDIDVAAEAVVHAVRRLRAVSPACRRPGSQPAGSSSEQPAPARQPLPGSQSIDSEGTESGRDIEAPFLDPLSTLARHYFECLPGAGAFPHDADAPGSAGSSATRLIEGEAGSPAAEAWVRFQLQVEGDAGTESRADARVSAALFQAYGCPHTLAVSAWLTGQLPGRSLRDLVPGTPSAWLTALEVPVEKLGRLLVVEDALRAAFREWERAT